MEKLSLLTIDSDTPRRLKIKAVTSTLHSFGAFNQAISLEEALSKLQTMDSADTIFIAEKFAQEDVMRFIKSAKELKSSLDAAFILVVSPRENLSQEIARFLVGGVDGVLCEPYSVDQFNEIVNIATRVRKERSAAREAGAIRFLLSQISEQISILAQLKAHGVSSLRENRKLVEMCQVFKSIDEAKRLQYHAIAMDIFEKAVIPKPVKVGPAYAGTSSRVRKKMEEKVLKKLSSDSPQNQAT